jgi:uncharacterized protein YraI
MPPKTPLLIVAGAVAVSVIAGIIFAVKQPAPLPEPSAPAEGTAPPTISASPAPPPKTTTPKPTPAQPAAPPAAAKPQTPPAPSQADALREVESCVVSMAIANDPNPPLNVRSAPNTESAIVGQLANGTFVTVEAEDQGWFQISGPTPGWISQQRTTSSCGQKVERVSFGQNSTLASISDQFIGTGSHTYRFNARQGQTFTLIRHRGPFPQIQAPDGSALVQVAGDENRPSWTGTLAQGGDYKVILESNFRGYKYSFDVQIK